MNNARAAAFTTILGILIWSAQNAYQSSQQVTDPDPGSGESSAAPKAPPRKIIPLVPRPFRESPETEDSKDSWVNGRAKDTEELAADLPGEFHHKNIGSKIDGSGMCVFTSIEHAATWQGIDTFIGFRDWCAAKYPGGGYPEKVVKLIAAYCKDKNIPVPPYLQWEGKDPETLLSKIDLTGRMACITYGWSPRYGTKISHMVNCSKYSGAYGVVLDNNFPGEDKYEWMSKAELIRRMKYGSNSAWIFVWLEPPPPPCPKNRS
jgi:hypothetical protein